MQNLTWPTERLVTFDISGLWTLFQLLQNSSHSILSENKTITDEPANMVSFCRAHPLANLEQEIFNDLQMTLIMIMNHFCGSSADLSDSAT